MKKNIKHFRHSAFSFQPSAFALLLMLYALCLIPAGFLQAQLYTKSGVPVYLNNGITVTAKNIDVVLNSNITGSNSATLYCTGSSSQSVNGNGYSVYGLSINNSSGVSLSGNLSISNILNIKNSTDIFSLGSSTLTLAGTITGDGYLSGTSSSNLTMSGTGQVGTLRFAGSGQTLNTLSLNRTGISSNYAALLGSALTVNALTLTNGILATGDNLLTWTKTGSLLPSAQTSYTANSTSYKNSYICVCDAGGSALSFTEPFDGSKGFRINNVGTDTWFPVGVDFTAPNRIWLNNTGTSDNLTVVMKKGDLDNTDYPVVQRIWYIKEAATGGTTASMQLFFTKQDNTGFGSSQDEVENGFDYTTIRLAQRNYDDNNYLDISQNSDVRDISSTTQGTEAYAKYTIGVSPDVSGSTDGINYFSRFMVVNDNAFILPVSVTNFRAQQNGDKALLSWMSNNETNIEKYVIERSADNMSYTVIGSVAALNSGTLGTPYTFTDLMPAEGKNYYRIKIVEKDGTTYYTNTQTLNFSRNSFIKVYPNPVQNKQFTVEINDNKAGRYRLYLYNVNGNIVFSDYINHTGGLAEYVIKLQTVMSAGIYKLRIKHDNGSDKYSSNIVIE